LTKEEALKEAYAALKDIAENAISFETGWCGSLADHVLPAIEAALAQPAQEPDELTIAYMSGLLDGKKQRPWVGLTDEQITEIYTKWESTKGTSWADLMRAVEAKLKEKNT